MGDGTRFDVENLISCGSDLIKLLEADKDINARKQCLQQFQTLQTQCDADFEQAQSSIQEYQNKLDSSRKKITETKLELVQDHTGSEVQELEEVSQTEHLLRDELSTVIAAVIDNLDQQSILIEEQRCALRKLEQEDMKKERILSMYASVTKIIPNLEDQSKISGHILMGDKKVVQKCEFDPAKETPFDTCNDIWKMIN